MSRKRRRKGEINIVPLIDVLIVLIFFFLMTMQFRGLSALDITPPEMETAGRSEAPDTPLVIGIDESGQFFFDDQAVSREALVEALQSRETEANSTTVLILASEEAPLKFVAQAMDEAKKAGFGPLRLQTR